MTPVNFSLWEPVSSSLWTEIIGWTLLHFCWQAAALVLAYVACRAAFRNWFATDLNRSYWVAASTLCGFFVMPFLTALLLLRQNASLPVGPLPYLAAIPEGISGNGNLYLETPIAWSSWLVTAWLVGVALFSLRFCAAWWHWRGIRVMAAPLPASTAQVVSTLARRMHVATSFEVRISHRAVSPLVTGFLRYTLLLPVTFFSELNPAQAEAILAHELAHIRRRDGILNVLQSVAETLFFFHPAVWWLSRDMRLQREMACDAEAAGVIGNVTCYAEALLSLEELRPASAPWALAARRGSLEERVRMLLRLDPQTGHDSLVARMGLALALMVFAGALWASTDPPPAPMASIAPVAPLAPPAPVHLPVVEPSPVIPPIAAPAPAASTPAAIAESPTGDSQEKPPPPLPPPPPSPANAKHQVVEAPRARAVPAPAVAASAPIAAAPIRALAQEAREPRSPRSPMAPKNSDPRQVMLDVLRNQLKEGAYQQWALEDVVYIILDEELRAFQRMGSDQEREHFIEQFWKRRDPTPDTSANEAKEEHYRRIAYANERFGAGSTRGWRTEMGRLYIQYGPPDEIVSQDRDGTPYQRWFYRDIRGVGRNVSFEFGNRPGDTR